jgi:hypothetical protein
MAEFRAAQAADVGAIVVIDPQGPGRREEIRALVRNEPAWLPSSTVRSSAS